MTVKKTISIPDSLDSLIEEFNKRHPFEPLILSQLAQKAFFEKIKSEDPELVEIHTKAVQVAVSAPVKATEILLEEEPVQPSKGETQTEPVKKSQKTREPKPTREVVCKNCGKTFTSRSEKAETCSGRCRSAYNRKLKKTGK